MSEKQAGPNFADNGKVGLMTRAFRSRPRIAIIGAGIGGLALSIALQRHGVAAEVFEQAHELTEIGAAVALSANGTRELRRFGVLEQLVAISTEPNARCRAPSVTAFDSGR